MEKIIKWLSEVDEENIRIIRMKNWVFYFNWFVIWSLYSIFLVFLCIYLYEMLRAIDLYIYSHCVISSNCLDL